MDNSRIKHECDHLYNRDNIEVIAYDITISLEDNEWCLFAEGCFNGTVIEIIYCPFCGERLSKDMQTKQIANALEKA